MERQLYLLEKNSVLERLTAGLTPDERREMEEDISTNGGLRGVKVWGKVILSGYEYYDFCHRHSIPFCLTDVPLRSEAEAVAWVCRNQLGRRFLPEERRKYLIGKLSRAERENNLQKLKDPESSAGLQAMFTAKYAKNNTFKTFVREKIGKEYSLVFMTVRKYENYAEALDVIYRSCPEFVNEHLAGRLRMSIERIESLSSLPMATVFSECRRWLSEPLETRLGRRRGKNPCSTQGDKAEELPSVSVKDMPAYDPDAEIVSLALTIPSWRSSIARVKAVSDIKETSREARLRLVEALILLKSTTDKLIYVLKEG